MEYSKYREKEIGNGVTIGDLQGKSLEIFKYFREICEKNNLRYWCGGGTCIGALRHKGFIPWDDDIDIFLPRPDYEKLFRIWNEVADTTRYALCRTDKCQNNHQTDMQLVDLNTTFINRHSQNENIKHGVSIDIMPFEGCPESKIARAFQIYHSVIYSIFNAQRLPDHQGKLIRYATGMILKIVSNPDVRYKLWKKHEKKMIQYNYDQAKTVKETITSFRAMFYPYPKEFFETIEVPFEDTTIRIPKEADKYLKRIFGDYMSLPPENERNIKHDVVYINLHEPFYKYKGIFYCKEPK